MTYSLYSISANALSPSGCAAYTFALNGFKPYTRAPWYQFSEQQVDNFDLNGGTNPAFPFMTGAGGWHQVGPMGWFGVRIVEEQLIIQPALPPQIPQVKLRTFIFGGAGIKATMNYTHSTITRVDVTKYLPPNSTDIYANQSMPFTIGFSLSTGHNMTIALGQTLTIENRRYFDNVTEAGNLVQCLPISSSGAYEPGQFPLAAVDGAASTRWQPTTRDPSSLTIDMSNVAFQPLTGVSFDWGSRPASAARITLYNSTSSASSASSPDSNSTSARTVLTLSNLTISAPYDAATNDVVKAYVGNMSYISFSSPVYSGQYLTLTIEGCVATGDEVGATVAEFNLYGTNGTNVLTGASSTSSSGNSTASASSGSVVVGNSTIAINTITPSTTNAAPSVLATASITRSSSPSSTTSTKPSVATQSVSAGVLNDLFGYSWLAYALAIVAGFVGSGY